MYKKLRIFAFLPMLCIMCVIWGFSSNTGEVSSQQSEGIIWKILSIAEEVTDVAWSDEEKSRISEQIHTPIRKLAHVTEYMLFAFSTIVPLFLYEKRIKRTSIITFIWCVSYACLDEIHQLLVPNRSGQLKDVCIDAIGIGLGILIYLFVRKNMNRRRGNKNV